MSSLFQRRSVIELGTVTFAGFLSQAIWLAAVPFSWTWDSATNLAIGRFFFGLPAEMWSVWEYYAPGYGVLLALLGIHHFDTLAGVRVGVLLIGGSMPLLLYLMLRPLAPVAALVAALAYALTFANAVFSTNLLVYHFFCFGLLVFGVSVTRYIVRPSPLSLALVTLAAVFATAIRPTAAFVLLAALVTLAAMGVIERRRRQHLLKAAALVLAVYVAATGVLSAGRQLALGGAFRFGLTRDTGSRVGLQGAYYPASRFELEFFPNENPVLVRPENGPMSRKLFDGVRRFLESGADFSPLTPDDPRNVDAAMRSLIDRPTIGGSYFIWWGVDASYGIDEGDRVSRGAWWETVWAQPRVLKYYAWNFWQSLFGPPMNVNYACTAAPCFYAELPAFVYEFTDSAGQKVFAPVVGPNVIREMVREHERANAARPFGEAAYSIARLPFAWKPLLSALLLASIFLVKGSARYFAIFCVGVVFVNNGTTALAWPVLPRYWEPAMPFVFAGAAITLARVVEQAVSCVRASGGQMPERYEFQILVDGQLRRTVIEDDPITAQRRATHLALAYASLGEVVVRGMGGATLGQEPSGVRGLDRSGPRARHID